MKDEIQFTLNGMPYWVADNGQSFTWDNEPGEYDNVPYPSMAEAQQAAINWEAGREDREAMNAADEESQRRYEKEQHGYKIGNFL